MSCTHVRSDFSAYLDGDLSDSRRAAVTAHVGSCAACAAHLDGLREAAGALRSLPRLCPPESLAASVLDRLEVESRGPGLALLFRPALSARPLMVPSLLPAALVLVCTLSFVLSLVAHDMKSTAQIRPWDATDTNASGSGTDIFIDEQLIGLAEQDIFVVTVVDKNGRVSYVKLIEGDQKTAYPIMHEMTLQRYEPGRDLNGQPVVTPTFQLISAIEVRAPRT
jgi:hypothetical protein